MIQKLKNISIKKFSIFSLIPLLLFLITSICSYFFENRVFIFISLIFLLLFSLLWLVYTFEKKYIRGIIAEVIILTIINSSRNSNNFSDIISLIFTIISIILVEVKKQNNSNAIKSRCDYYYNKLEEKYIKELKDNKDENDKPKKLKLNDMYFESITQNNAKHLQIMLLLIPLSILILFNILKSEFFECFSTKVKINVDISLVEIEVAFVGIIIAIYSLISNRLSRPLPDICKIRKKPLSERYDNENFDKKFIEIFNNTIPEDLREYFGEYTGNEIIILEGRKTNKKTEEIKKGFKYHFEIVKII